MNNMLIPVANGTGNWQKNSYLNDRGIARVPETVGEQGDAGQSTIDGAVGGPSTYIKNPPSVPAQNGQNPGSQAFGLHSSCKNMAAMFDAMAPKLPPTAMTSSNEGAIESLVFSSHQTTSFIRCSSE